jgi:S-adenosylmethionine-dependent methyltransferase
MVEAPQPHFDAGADAWAEYKRGPLGRIRQQVTWHNLAPHLPRVGSQDAAVRVLDAGGGSGELALRLLEAGYYVWLLDYAPNMLRQARQAVQALPRPVQDRLTLVALAVDEAPAAFAPCSFDLITCHTLIEYLPDPQATLRALVGLLCPGGVLSLSFVNRHAQVLRRIWSLGDPQGALRALEDGAFCAALFDLPGSAYTAAEVEAWLAPLGLEVVGARGVRVFADYVPRQSLDDPSFLEALLLLEQAVAGRAPFWRLARYVHLISKKDVEHS